MHIYVTRHSWVKILCCYEFYNFSFVNKSRKSRDIIDVALDFDVASRQYLKWGWLYKTEQTIPELYTFILFLPLN